MRSYQALCSLLSHTNSATVAIAHSLMGMGYEGLLFLATTEMDSVEATPCAFITVTENIFPHLSHCGTNVDKRLSTKQLASSVTHSGFVHLPHS